MTELEIANRAEFCEQLVSELRQPSKAALQCAKEIAGHSSPEEIARIIDRYLSAARVSVEGIRDA